MDAHCDGEQHFAHVTRVLDRRPRTRWTRPTAQGLVVHRADLLGERADLFADQRLAPVSGQPAVGESACHADVVLAEQGWQFAHGFSIA